MKTLGRVIGVFALIQLLVASAPAQTTVAGFTTEPANACNNAVASGTFTPFLATYPADEPNLVGVLLGGADINDGAVDITGPDDANDIRKSITLDWSGRILPNGTGDDFVIYEQGPFPEGFAVAVREFGSSSFTQYRYEHADAIDGTQIATGFDIVDFGISGTSSIDAIRITNIHNSTANTNGTPSTMEDRIDSATEDEGFVLLDAGAGTGSPILRGPLNGPGFEGTEFADDGLDADFSYVAALRDVEDAPVFVAPEFTFIKNIIVGGLGANPGGLAYDEETDTLYVATFDSKRVLSINNILASDPDIAIFAFLADDDATSAGPVTFGGGRGLSNVSFDPVDRKLYAAGDPGTADGAVVRYNLDGTVDAILNGNGGSIGLRASGVLGNWGESGNTLATNVGNNLVVLDGTLNTQVGASITGPNPFHRDVVAVGNDIFASRSFDGFGAGVADGITRFSGGTAGDPAGYTGEIWASFSGNAANAVAGVHYYPFGAAVPRDYIIGVDRTADEVLIYNAADAAPATAEITLGSADGITEPQDTTTGNLFGFDYLFVSQLDPTDGSLVSVFRIENSATPSTSATSWTHFE
jgi:hypothetical protein